VILILVFENKLLTEFNGKCKAIH